MTYDTESENLIALLALIGLRALAEYDPAEYARVTDASKAEIDGRIGERLAGLPSEYSDHSLLVEVRSKYSQLKSISEDSRGRTELHTAMKQQSTEGVKKSSVV